MIFRRRAPEADDYDKQQASWQIEHNANQRDLTPEQGRRMLTALALWDTDLDPQRVAFVDWLKNHGRISDEIADAAPARRAEGWPTSSMDGGGY